MCLIFSGMWLVKRTEINLCDILSSAVFWYVTTCNPQPAANSLSVKAARFYEPSAGSHEHQITLCSISEDRNLHSQYHEDCKSRGEWQIRNERNGTLRMRGTLELRKINGRQDARICVTYTFVYNKGDNFYSLWGSRWGFMCNLGKN